MTFLDALRGHSQAGFRHRNWTAGLFVRWNARTGYEWHNPREQKWAQVPWSLLGVGQLLCAENLLSDGWEVANGVS